MRPFAPEFILTVIPDLLPYLSVTLAVALGSIVAGSLFGALLAWAKLSTSALLRRLAVAYTYAIRCTPPRSPACVSSAPFGSPVVPDV